MLNKIAIFGLGLLGGSLCRGIRSMPGRSDITAYARDPQRIRGAVDIGVVDRVEGLDTINLENVDLVVISTPIVISVELLRTVLNNAGLGERALVIDVGSVKGILVGEAESHPRGDRFIGCHPMAGSEKMGFDNSRDDLYKNAPVIITPHSRNRDEDIDAIRKFWSALGARTVVISAHTHDVAVAYTSHLPHLTACALMDLVNEYGAQISQSGIGNFIGSGLRDVTRIAAGSPDMWADIMATNRENILYSLDELMEKLGSLKKLLQDDETAPAIYLEMFGRIKAYREKI